MDASTSFTPLLDSGVSAEQALPASIAINPWNLNMDEGMTLATKRARKRVGAELPGLKIQRASVNCFIQRKKEKKIQCLLMFLGRCRCGQKGQRRGQPPAFPVLPPLPPSLHSSWFPSTPPPPSSHPGTASQATLETDSLLIIPALRRS